MGDPPRTLQPHQSMRHVTHFCGIVQTPDPQEVCDPGTKTKSPRTPKDMYAKQISLDNPLTHMCLYLVVDDNENDVKRPPISGTRKGIVFLEGDVFPQGYEYFSEGEEGDTQKRYTV